MQIDLDLEVIEVAEENRANLDTNFFTQRDYIQAKLSDGQWPEALRQRGALGEEDTSKLVNAIMQELHLLLCTNDEKYAQTRTQSSNFSKIVVSSVAGYVAAACGISVGAATGGVAFIAIAVFQVGVGVFCRLVPPEI